MKIIDISPMITSELAVFPGDQAFEREVSMDFSMGDHLGLSSIKTTLHLGAHADAPSHYHAEGQSIEERPLTAYVGPCEVKSVLGLKPGARIEKKNLGSWVPRQKRVLFRTDSFLEFNKWTNDFNSLSPEVIEFLQSQAVCLVGIDTPSVDPAQSKQLESHQALYRSDLCVLEGLVLNKTRDEEDYFLVAPPLKMKGADASPLRALLLKDFS